MDEIVSRKTFDQEMQEMKDETLLLGRQVETAVLESVQALQDNDLNRSYWVLRNDLAINRERYEIETSIMVLIATRQPVAHNLRMLAASIDVCTDLERIGDYAKGIAKINIRSDGLDLPALLTEIRLMAEKAIDMLHRAMKAYAEEDMLAAKSVIEDDDALDVSYAGLYQEALQHVISDARNIEGANYLIWIAHNLERLGDRATNICERVIFIVSGERPTDVPVMELFPG